MNALRYIPFGKTAWKVSAVGFGCWQAGMTAWGTDYSEYDASSAIKSASDSGVNFFDTAEIYGNGISERILGEALKDRDAFVATKVAGYNATRIERSFDRSLRNLGRGIDLYQLHWVPSIYTNLEKVLRSMESLVRRGKVPYIGLSNFPASTLKSVSEMLGREEFVSNQVQYSLVDRRIENSLVPAMQDLRLQVIAYSPLGRGRLSGKYFDSPLPKTVSRFSGFRPGRYDPDPALKKSLQEVSSKHGASIAEVSLAWVTSRGVLPIPGAKRPDQAIANSISGNLVLDPEDLRSLDSASVRFKSGEYGNLMPRLVPNRAIRLVSEGVI